MNVFDDLHPSESLAQHADGAVGQAQHAADVYLCAKGEQVLRPRLHDLRISLSDGDERFAQFVGLLNGLY